jgi:hypothetical protein
LVAWVTESESHVVCHVKLVGGSRRAMVRISGARQSAVAGPNPRIAPRLSGPHRIALANDQRSPAAAYGRTGGRLVQRLLDIAARCRTNRDQVVITDFAHGGRRQGD